MPTADRLRALTEHLHLHHQLTGSQPPVEIELLVDTCIAVGCAGSEVPIEQLPTRALFEGGPQVSCVGLGAWPLAGAHGPVGQDDGIEAVKTAVRDVSMNFIDTAEAYELEGHGGSETVIGLALSANPELRERAFVTTKVSRGPYTAEGIRASAERSLARLQLDQLELLQLHHFRVGKMRNGDDAPTIMEQMHGLKALQDEGKIKYIGLNNANAVQLQMAWDTGVRFHTVQVRYHMFARYIEDDVIPW
jgi:aryl-alcohol dehydrogenase-like predicted oxidoreductase